MAWEQLSLFTDEELGIRKGYDLIGLTGYAQSGKDTVAQFLVNKYGYRRIAFADKIRDFLYDLNPQIKVGYDGVSNIRILVDNDGWDTTKQIPQVRQLLQDIGVSARNIFGENFWVDQALESIKPGEKVVVTDVRFNNEADHVKLMGGQIWRIRRPGVTSVNSHISETQMDGYKVDQIFLNSGSLDELEVLLKTRMQNAFTK